VLIEDALGSSVSLDIVGYQFPTRQPDGEGFDWDANWLLIRGTIAAGERCWSFNDPSMTTREAAELVVWLRDVASGAVPPATAGAERGLLWFTEPNLSVRLESRAGSVANLAWYFAQDSSPPGSSEALGMAKGIRFGSQSTLPR
jgi:hypothetical protein